MIKLWGRLSSINVQKVVWCLDEVGLAYERVDAGGAFGIVDTAEYRALNPNGLVPVFEEDGFVLWESNAIVRYLAATHEGAGLLPRDPRTRADADRWMDWQATAASPGLRDAFHQLIRTPAEKRDPALVAASVRKSEEFASILDDHLARRTYVAGDTFSVGDIAVGLHMNRWFGLPVDRRPRPHAEAWLNRVRARAGAQGVFAIPIT